FSCGDVSNILTNIDGSATGFVPDFVKTKYLTVRVHRDGYVPLSMGWRAQDSGTPMPTDLTFDLEHPVQIGGKVVDDAGNPIDGATVRVSIWDPNLRNDVPRPDLSYVSARTDHNGHWTFDAPAQVSNLEIGVFDQRYGNGPDSYPMQKITDTAPL